MNFKKNSIVFLVVFMITMMCSFVNASNEQKFMELLIKDQEAVEIIEELEKNLSKSKQQKGQISYNARGLIDDESSVAIKEIVADFDFVKESKKESMLFSLNLNGHDFAKGELAINGNLYGINIEELTDGMIGIRNQNLEKLAEKFGVTKEEFDELEKEFKGENQISDFQAKKLLKIYEKAASKAVKNNVTLEENVKFVDNCMEYITNKYTATIDTKSGVEFLIKFFEEVKRDKSLYNIMINNFMTEYGVDREEAFDEFDEVFEGLKEARKELNKNESMYNTVLFKVSLYERNGKTVVTEFDMQEEATICFKAFNENDMDILELEINDKSIGEDIHLRLTMNQSNEKIEATFRVYGTEVDVNYIYDENFYYTKNIEKVYHDAEILKLVMNLSSKADRKVAIINNKNTFILNDKTIEKIEERFMQIENNATNFEGKMEKVLEGYENPTVARANFAAFIMEISDMKMEFMYETMDLKQIVALEGIYITEDKYVVAAAIGEGNVDRIQKINVNNYFVKLSDVLPEYELTEQLKDEMVCKLTNTKFVSERFGEMYVNKTGNKIYLRNPYKYSDMLYISDYDVVTLKE